MTRKFKESGFKALPENVHWLFPMETPRNYERLSEDTLAGALARRKELLNRGDLSAWEELQSQAYMLGIPTTLERAIDKITALQLFRQQYPDRQGLKTAITNATDSLTLWYRRKTIALLKSTANLSEEEGELVEVVVHRLPNGNWVEKGNGHFIHPCFPWAQLLDAKLEARQEQTQDLSIRQGEPVSLETESVAGAIAKVLGRTG